MAIFIKFQANVSSPAQSVPHSERMTPGLLAPADTPVSQPVFNAPVCVGNQHRAQQRHDSKTTPNQTVRSQSQTVRSQSQTVRSQSGTFYISEFTCIVFRIHSHYRYFASMLLTSS